MKNTPVRQRPLKMTSDGGAVEECRQCRCQLHKGEDTVCEDCAPPIPSIPRVRWQHDGANSYLGNHGFHSEVARGNYSYYFAQVIGIKLSVSYKEDQDNWGFTVQYGSTIVFGGRRKTRRGAQMAATKAARRLQAESLTKEGQL